ncbi:MAG: ABC transporter permease [Deltaproteobacteria bacterium]|jgi:putative ABC transport system permease protein|nr:ABC transporter permease [Deltaproteobacteria bacterium]
MKRNTKFLGRMLLFSLVRRRSRLLVALVGVAVGATVLLGLATLCYDIPRQLSREFRSYGANLVFVSEGGSGRLPAASLDRAVSLLPSRGLVGVTPFRYEAVRSHMLPYTAVATLFDGVRKTSPYWRVTGEWPSAPGELLLGVDVAEATGLSPGSPFPLDGRNSSQARYARDFKVTGTVASGGVEDGFVFMSIGDMESMTGEAGVFDLAEASLTLGSDELARVAAGVRAGVPGVDPRLVTRVTRSEEQVMGKLTALVYLVTLVVLTLTMICVATTMMTVVLERRREIGLKKALGAGNRRVAREFLAEGLFLGVLGGLAGSFLGLAFARLVSASVFGRALTPEPWLVPATVGVSALVTVAACLAPVKRAVDVEPALVLRGE